MTNSGVPVSVIDSDADEIAPNDLTVQTPLRLAKIVNAAGIVSTEGESDEPLFRLTIIRFTKLTSTTIGACNSHVLCTSFSQPLLITFFVLTKVTQVDGSGLILFLKLLSRLYQGLEPAYPPPQYEPEAIKFPDPPRDPSPIFDLYDPLAPSPTERPERKAMEFVALRLTAAQLAQIHRSVTKGVEHLKISRVDVVVGLLSRCLSEVEPESKPVDTIVNVINVSASVFPSNNFAHFHTAPRNGHVPRQRGGQCDLLAPHRPPSLRRCRASW